MTRSTDLGKKTEDPLGEFLGSPSSCAFALGFLLGFEAGKSGACEPNIDEIARSYYEAQQDSVLPIKAEPDKE